jgi:hypothetical protein
MKHCDQGAEKMFGPNMNEAVEGWRMLQNEELRNLLFFTSFTAPWALATDFQFHDHFTDGRSPSTSD